MKITDQTYSQLRHSRRSHNVHPESRRFPSIHYDNTWQGLLIDTGRRVVVRILVDRKNYAHKSIDEVVRRIKYSITRLRKRKRTLVQGESLSRHNSLKQRARANQGTYRAPLHTQHAPRWSKSDRSLYSRQRRLWYSTPQNKLTHKLRGR